MLTWSNTPEASYCNPIRFSSKANSGDEQENGSFYKPVTYILPRGYLDDRPTLYTPPLPA